MRSRTPLHAGAVSVFAALCVVFAGCAAPEYVPPEVHRPAGPLTLDGVVELALRNNPGLAAAGSRVEAARAAIDEAWAAYLPVLQLFGRFTQADMPSRTFGTILDQERFSNAIDFNDPGVTRNWHPGIGGGITLYDGGRRWHRARAAEAGAAAEDAALDAARRDIAYEAARAYFLVHKARDAAAAHEAAAENLAVQVRIAEARRGEGALRGADVLGVAARLADARHAAVAARGSAVRAETGLRILLGLGAAEELALVPPALDAPPARPALDACIARARERRPEIDRARLMFEAARAQADAAHAGWFPDVTIFGEFGFDARKPSIGHPNWLWGVEAVESVFDAFKTPLRVRQAMARVAEAHAAGRAVVLDVERDVVHALLDAEEADARGAAAAGEERLAVEALRVAEVELAEGKAAPARVLDRKAALTAARARLAAAAHDRTFSRIALAHATGEYPPCRVDVAGGDPPGGRPPASGLLTENSR